LSVVAQAWDLAGNRSAAILRTYHTVDSPQVAAWWPPAQVAPIGTKVVGANALPAGCAGWPDSCWKDAVRNGTVKYFQAGGSIVSEGRPVVHAFFQRMSPADGVTPQWCLMPEWQEDGWKPSPTPAVVTTQLSCRNSSIAFVQGSATGYILPDPGGATCTQYELSGASANPTPVACP
jgi:hypothetical protein